LIKADGNRKPVVGFIAGVTVSRSYHGHAGAIVGGSDDTAEAKKEIMRAFMQWIPAEIGKSKKEVLGSAFLIY
jgi:succinyl-CoA synthetase alpha subunit